LRKHRLGHVQVLSIVRWITVYSAFTKDDIRLKPWHRRRICADHEKGEHSERAYLGSGIIGSNLQAEKTALKKIF